MQAENALILAVSEKWFYEVLQRGGIKWEHWWRGRGVEASVMCLCVCGCVWVNIFDLDGNSQILTGFGWKCYKNDIQELLMLEISEN